MFTGIVDQKATVKDIEEASEGKRITMERPESYKKLEKGESISVSGVCLTVEAFKVDSMSFFLAEETLEKTWFSNLVEEDTVNLERSLRPQDRMGGHIVQGHVEASVEVIEVEKVDEDSEGWNMKFSLPEELQNLVVYKGFIAVEGVSLTVTEVKEDTFSVMIIPETWEVTNLSEKNEGDKVNIETDMMGKYVHKMMDNKK